MIRRGVRTGSGRKPSRSPTDVPKEAKPPSANRPARQECEEPRQDIRELVRHLVTAYYRSSMEGILRDHNPAFNRVLGFPPEKDLRGLELSDFWQDPSERATYLKELVGRGSLINFEVRARTVSGERIVCLADCRILKDEAGRPSGIEGTFTDITELKRAEDALRVSEEKFATLFRSIPDAVLLSTLAEGRIVEANDAVSRLTGFPIEELLDRTALELGLWADPADRGEYVAQLRSSGRVVGFEARFRMRSGEDLVGLVSGELIELPDGPHVLSVVRDITERKKTEKELAESRSLLQAALESTADGILVVDRSGKIVGFNRLFARMWNIPDEVLETKDDDRALNHVLGQLKEPGAFLRKVRELYGRPEEESFDVLEFKDGRVFERYSRPQRLEGQVLGRVWSFRDVTVRKTAEDEIRRLNSELEERVRARTEQLEAANRELEAFAYSASHDLRAPLRGIDGWSLALLEDYHDRLDEEGRRFLERIRSETQRMGRLIDDLLHFSRVTRGEIDWKRVDLTAMAETIVARLRRENPPRDVRVVVKKGLAARGDPRLLEIVLNNLLDNAFKFSRDGAPAAVEFGRVERDGKKAFFVRDNGVGFDMAYAPKLFMMFQRLHSASEFPGTGVGLATVQRIINRLGGRVWADSAPGKGATFYFTLEEPA